MDTSSSTFKQIALKNILSFGESSRAISLNRLNVLIGPNGSGKSNLIEALGLFHSLPKDLADAIRIGGGITEWLWKGTSDIPVATIEVVLGPPSVVFPIRYGLRLTRSGYFLEIVAERIEKEPPTEDEFYFIRRNGRAVLLSRNEKTPRELKREDIDPQQSVLSQRKDPDQYPELTETGKLFDGIRIYRDWEFGTLASVRDRCSADLPDVYLEEDASNLGMVLARLLADPSVNKELLKYLKLFYEDASDLHARPQQGLVEIGLEEKHLRSTIPLKRMSDGTIRWLALLTILLNPTPPPLVCIEEPELGLHPDMIHELGGLLLVASERMQLIVTTHSDALIEEFTDYPEMVLVCEKEQGQTQIKRLEKEPLVAWLEQYSLGQLWRKGEIGGNRW